YRLTFGAPGKQIQDWLRRGVCRGGGFYERETNRKNENYRSRARQPQLDHSLLPRAFDYFPKGRSKHPSIDHDCSYPLFACGLVLNPAQFPLGLPNITFSDRYGPSRGRALRSPGASTTGVRNLRKPPSPRRSLRLYANGRQLAHQSGAM